MKSTSRWCAGRLFLVIVLVLSLSSFTTCGGGSSPSHSTPVTTPRPTPAPVQAPSPTARSIDYCPLGLGTGTGLNCPVETPNFLNDVEKAIDLTIQQYPWAFDTTKSVGGGEYLVKSTGEYYVGVITNLQNAGFCAGYDGEELWVKNSNAFNDQYNIRVSSGFIRRGLGAYRSTCYPAAWPQPAPPLTPTPGCSLPPSHDVACAREDPRLLHIVQDAIETYRVAHPDVINGDVILDFDAYHNGVVDLLRQKGFCARFDGEEVAMKNTNDFSEQFKIDLSSGKIRNDDGTYRATCYPATF